MHWKLRPNELIITNTSAFSGSAPVFLSQLLLRPALRLGISGTFREFVRIHQLFEECLGDGFGYLRPDLTLRLKPKPHVPFFLQTEGKQTCSLDEFPQRYLHA